MQISKTPDRNVDMMRQDFGTVCLITDIQADYYLKQAKNYTNMPPEDRYSRPCGGSNGFDDYVERWH